MGVTLFISTALAIVIEIILSPVDYKNKINVISTIMKILISIGGSFLVVVGVSLSRWYLSLLMWLTSLYDRTRLLCGVTIHILSPTTEVMDFVKSCREDVAEP